MALDLKTGKVLWSRRATEDDLFMGGCDGPNTGEQCPSTMGPDYDIGNSPILMTLPNGKRALFVGTKGADVVALDPDTNGAVLFRVNRPASRSASPDAAAAGSSGAAPATAARCTTAWARAGLGAVHEHRRQDGLGLHRAGARRGNAGSALRRRRFPASCSRAPATAGSSPCRRRRQAAVGVQHRAAVRDRQQGRRARAARSPSSGAVVVDGMVYIGSGYAISAGASGGNVLLAFGVE